MSKTRTIQAEGFRWQVQVREVGCGFNGFYRDDSEGTWSAWKRVFTAGMDNGGSWRNGDAAMKSLVAFVSPRAEG